MLCAISGEPPQEPVASKRSGQIFEKRLIEAYVAEHGKDPVTGEELGLDDLIMLQSSRAVKPRPPTLTSIPSMLSAFQNEWDALALETYQLKVALTQSQQELSTSLYNNDASTRVIARLTRERDEARNALSKISATDRKAPVSNGASSNDGSMQIDGTPLPDDVIQLINDTQAKLSSNRRKRPIPDDYAKLERIRNLQPIGTPTSTVPKGSRAFDIGSKGDFALIGGNDGSGCIFSIRKQETIQAFDVGDAAITSVVCIDYDEGEKSKHAAVLASADGTVALFSLDRQMHAFNVHAGPAACVALHPCKDIAGSVGRDKSFVLYGISSQKMLTQVFTDTELTACEFHPDGHLFAAGGENGKVLMFSVVSQTLQATFDVGGPVQDLSFSENGIWIAIVERGSKEVQIWDLRKGTAIAKLQFGGRVDAIEFDWSGQFLAVGGPSAVEVQYYDKSTKSWLASPPMTRAIGSSSIKWGPLAKGLAVLQVDGSINMVK